jgi:hypothetical protein
MLLSLTSLSTGDDIVTLQDSWDSVRLDRSRVRVAAEIDVLDHHWMKAGGVELS